MNKTIVKIFNVILVIVSLVMLSVTGTLIYYKTAGKDKIPTAITSTYVTELTNPATGEKLSAIECNYFANKNNKGYEVVELLFNAYSGVSKQAIYSRGFQLVFDKNNESTLYYYDRYDGVSFETGHEYKFGDKMIIDINGQSYAIALDGTYTVTSYSLKPLSTFFAITTFGLSTEISNPIKTTVTEVEYTFEDLLEKIASIVNLLVMVLVVVLFH